MATEATPLSRSVSGRLLDVPTTLAAVTFLLLVALLNARGVKESLRANIVMTAARAAARCCRRG